MFKTIHVEIRNRVFHEDDECFPQGGETSQTFHFRLPHVFPKRFIFALVNPQGKNTSSRGRSSYFNMYIIFIKIEIQLARLVLAPPRPPPRPPRPPPLAPCPPPRIFLQPPLAPFPPPRPVLAPRVLLLVAPPRLVFGLAFTGRVVGGRS